MKINNNPSFPSARGQKLSGLCREITQNNIDRYAAISGDDNPLHINSDYAAKTKFGSTIAHGMLVLRLVEDMMLKNFGENWVGGGGLEVRFKQPAFPGDSLVAEGSIKNIRAHSDSKRVLCEVKVKKSTNDIVLSGTTWLIIRKE